jgi:hypothetical protein
MIEVKFQGRGGQGAVTASELLGRSFFLEGKCPQAFSCSLEAPRKPLYGFCGWMNSRYFRARSNIGPCGGL